MNTNARAIFLDIDGTLIPFGAEAPCEQDRTALLRARAAGHKVLINTGRSSGFLPPVLRTADYLDGFLCGCGTQLIIGGKTLFKRRGQLYCAKEGCGFVKNIEKTNAEK